MAELAQDHHVAAGGMRRGVLGLAAGLIVGLLMRLTLASRFSSRSK